MKKLRDFECVDCGTFEQFVRDNRKTVICKCGNIADRKISAAKYFQNTTGKSPSLKNRA